MTQSLTFSLQQTLAQTLSMQQYLSMQTSMLMGIPIPAFDRIIDNIAANPEKYDKRSLFEVATEARQTKVQSFFPYLTVRNPGARASGVIVNLDLILASAEASDLAKEACVDGVYRIDREIDTDKPEFVPSEYLHGSGQKQLDIQVMSNFKNALQLYNFLFKERNWIAGQLREVYNKIGEGQREFIASLDTNRINIYSYEQLAEDMNLHASSISRLINPRLVAIEHDGRAYVLPSRELLVNKDEWRRNIVFPLINSVLADEFRQGKAFSDEEIKVRVNRVARRTIAKYRERAGIPSTYERGVLYDWAVLDKPYEIKTTLQRLVGFR